MINRSNPDCYLQQIIIAVTKESDEFIFSKVKTKLGAHWFIWAPAAGSPWVIIDNKAPLYLRKSIQEEKENWASLFS